MRRDGFNFGRSYVACTGRVSSDMALKCSVAGIPLVLSRGATTSLAISIAQRTGLCIIGLLWTVYSLTLGGGMEQYRMIFEQMQSGV